MITVQSNDVGYIELRLQHEDLKSLKNLDLANGPNDLEELINEYAQRDDDGLMAIEFDNDQMKYIASQIDTLKKTGVTPTRHCELTYMFFTLKYHHLRKALSSYTG